MLFLRFGPNLLVTNLQFLTFQHLVSPCLRCPNVFFKMSEGLSFPSTFLVSFSQVLEHKNVQCPHVSSFQLPSSEKLEVLLRCHTKFSACQRSVRSGVLLSSERKLSFWHIRSVNVTQLLRSLLLVLLLECVKLLRRLVTSKLQIQHNSQTLPFRFRLVPLSASGQVFVLELDLAYGPPLSQVFQYRFYVSVIRFRHNCSICVYSFFQDTLMCWSCVHLGIPTISNSPIFNLHPFSGNCTVNRSFKISSLPAMSKSSM